MNNEIQINKRWWEYGYVWFLIAGPLLVVVASMITIYLAVTRPDAVIDDYYNKGIHINETLAAEKAALLPAIQGRNHAATVKEKNNH